LAVELFVRGAHGNAAKSQRKSVPSGSFRAGDIFHRANGFWINISAGFDQG
jgi:hypothetical protein